MRVKRYPERLRDTSYSRREIQVEHLRNHRELPGFPEHKHEGDRAIFAPAPDLGQVLREIDGHLYQR